ncbi:52 kDa repressor of the inhibitor of the protein kinase isoform X2 [Halyomorpha halys]|uniref:52 kDa repressor of the inhibitor of the protein kinase isoform X2 n=1 Tax=Halyomorpha halys TaxID=286706 RepID=UPI000D0C7D68|nr:52 kDa repressor of the inhibitor of the protein kinase-like isoform X2 [Halyomorpha halys]
MPGSVCSVAMCKSNAVISKKLGDNVRFFTFPKDAKFRKEWVKRCYRGEKFNPTNKRICSKHFKPDDFEDAIEAKIQNRLPKILKRDCIPSLNLKTGKKLNFSAQNLSTTKTMRLERAAKRKQKDFIKRILEAEKEQDYELENDNVESINKQKDIDESAMMDTNQNDETVEARESELERRISQFISSKNETRRWIC